MPIFNRYVVASAGSNVCQGPVGLPMVLPVYTDTTPSAFITMIATSMCNGTDMSGLWHWNQNIYQTTANAPVSHASWLYIALQDNHASATSIASIPTLLPPWNPMTATLFTPPKPRPRVVPGVIRAGRRALRRSIDIYARFRGMDEIRRFIRGEEITYEGNLYRYRVRKTIRVVDQTMRPIVYHTPYSLRVVDKTTDRNLASGCVYIPGLPMIDQLLALSFHIQDVKDEQKFLDSANWTPRLPARRMLEAA